MASNNRQETVISYKSIVESADVARRTVSALVCDRLSLIKNWTELAHKAQYSVKALSRICGVSVRSLEKYFVTSEGVPPIRWLKRIGMNRAMELLQDGKNVKETAFQLGYEDPSHFSREFKKVYGFAPKFAPHKQSAKIALRIPP